MGSADWGLKSSSRVLLIQNINPISWALRFACIGAREAYSLPVVVVCSSCGQKTILTLRSKQPTSDLEC